MSNNDKGCDVCGAEPGRCMTTTICQQVRDRRRESSPTDKLDRLTARKIASIKHALAEDIAVDPRMLDAVCDMALETFSSSDVATHAHRCMSCGERWFCPHPPSDCKAGENAFPSITLRGPDGPTVFHHACRKKP